MKINTRLSLDRCWDMVNRIQLGTNAQEILERCAIAKEWLTKNEVISNDDYDELMKSVAYLSREAYRQY